MHDYCITISFNMHAVRFTTQVKLLSHNEVLPLYA